MDLPTTDRWQDSFWDPPMFETGVWLRARRGVMETNECAWLEVLHGFDADGGYAADGHLTGASWLIWACGMARSTAYEKLRLAHELARRPIVKEAFAGADISYSAVRAICSLDDPPAATDAALVHLARYGTVLDVEAAVRYYRLLGGQDLPPFEPTRRDVSSRRGHFGLGQLRAVLSNDELAFVEAVLKAFMASRSEAEAVAAGPFADGSTGPRPGPEPVAEPVPEPSARADIDPSEVGETDPAPSLTPPAAPVAEPEESARADTDSSEVGDTDPAPSLTPPDAPVAEPEESARADTDSSDVIDAADWRVVYGTSRADALMDVFSVALANLGGGHTAGADRYMVHVVADAEGLRGEPGGTAELVDGSMLPEGTAGRLACDATFVAHLLAGGSEPLALGRRVRDWTPAQRRAVRVRDRGRCRFPGCHRGVTDIHHIVPWSEGGGTDLSNAALLCTRHHTIVHQGFRAEGDGNCGLIFRRPDGSVLGVSYPSRRPRTLVEHPQRVAA